MISQRTAGILGTALVLALGAFLTAPAAAQTTTPYVHLDRHETYKRFSEARVKDGVAVQQAQDGGGLVRLGTNPRAATDSSNTYNGGRYYYGTLVSRVYEPRRAFDVLVPSWNARTPRGTWLKLDVRVRSGGKWSAWFTVGIWASGTPDIKRRSVSKQNPRWEVDVDTLRGRNGAQAGAYQYRLRLMSATRDRSPVVRKLAFATSQSWKHGRPIGVPALERAWGKNLNVPARSQMVYPDGGEVWCSPTSLAMVMQYWAARTGQKNLEQSVPAVARGVRDFSYGWGNWPFNTAYASAYGLEGTVSRFAQIEQVERWIDAGIPVIASVAWNNNHSGQRLSGAPLRVSYGHLLVIRGFTRSGDVIVNDPAGADDSKVRRVYDRAEFERAWLRNPYSSGGAVYLIHPRGWATPGSYAARGSW